METREDVRHLVKAWMSAPDHKVTIETPLSEALRRMRSHRVRHLLVVDRERLVGVISDRDLGQPGGKLWAPGAEESIGREQRVGDAMSADPITVDDEDSTSHAARLMIDRGIGCLPVMRDRVCVGVLTRTDLLKALAYAADPDATWLFEMRHTA